MQLNIHSPLRLAAVAIFAFTLVGCTDRAEHKRITPTTKPTVKETVSKDPATDDVSVERAKLDPADKALVDAQEWCAISNDERLGSMGPPIKLTIKGQPVFVCCKGCVRKAEANPDATLAKVEELKAKAKGKSP